MKLKITTRFLFTLIITLFISFICYIILNLFLLYGPFKDSKAVNSLFFNPKTHIEQLQKTIKYDNGKLYLEENDILKLKQNSRWLQILDENGDEIYSKFKPKGILNHYNLTDFIYYNKYTWSLAKGSTAIIDILEVRGKKFSCIMGFPQNKAGKATLFYAPDTVVRDVFLVIGMIIILISLITGYIFSIQFAKPTVKIINGIRTLAKGEYDSLKSHKKSDFKGIYKDVYYNIDNLSQTLKSSELMRKEIENTREEWISNITHDLKTPLASIKGYSDLLFKNEYELSDEERIKYAEIIQGKANYMGELIEDLKLTYQLKNSIIPLNKKEENIVEILRDIVIDILNNPKYEEKEINFACDIEEIPYVCDAKLVRRAFTNLIYNAVVHNQEDTKVNISIKYDNGIKITIEDDGKGISQEDLKRLFERYYRGTNTGEAHRGSGLGMAISKQIIEAHNGQIKVNSILGEGTTINISI